MRKMYGLTLMLVFMLVFMGCSGEVNVEGENSQGDKGTVAEKNKGDFTYDDMKGEIIGNSDKDFTDITKDKPGTVRNDSTGNWRSLTIAKPVNLEEYAMSYSDIHIEDDKEIHFIINFTYKTTTEISKSAGLVYVTVLEYQDKEEHDANVLGTGEVLADYIIYPDGDIEKI